MNIFHTQDKAFNGLLTFFDELPKVIPASSVLICDDKKPILILCMYYDAEVVFIHGMYRAKDTTSKEYLKASIIAEQYIGEKLLNKVSFVAFTKVRAFKKLLLKNNFKSEEITMLVRAQS